MPTDSLVVLAAEGAGRGPDRTRYEMTAAGRECPSSWLFTPDVPTPGLQSTIYAKTLSGLVLGDDAQQVLDLQRTEHLDRRRETTRRERGADLATALLCDHALFDFEADLRLIDLTLTHLFDLRRQVLG